MQKHFYSYNPLPCGRLRTAEGFEKHLRGKSAGVGVPKASSCVCCHWLGYFIIHISSATPAATLEPLVLHLCIPVDFFNLAREGGSAAWGTQTFHNRGTDMLHASICQPLLPRQTQTSEMERELHCSSNTNRGAADTVYKPKWSGVERTSEQLLTVAYQVTSDTNTHCVV